MKRREQRIPVMRPLLPGADKIQPYLAKIDTSRIYSNFGPLAFQLEERLADMLKVPPYTLLSMANGTAALTLILRSMNIEPRTFCILPSWTFVATAAAAIAADMIPFFIDVDETTWALDPQEIAGILKYIPGKVGAVMVVAPFGYPVPLQPWDEFTDKTGIPVVVDAAAAFDTVMNLPECRNGKTPVMVSLHATKTLGIGEGALVLADDRQLVHRIRQMSNFGFSPTRDVVLPGVNAKLSEYSAAVGLAALDDWPEKRQKWKTITDHYQQALDNCGSKRISHRLNKEWVSSTCNVRIPPNCSENVIEQLGQAGIESRKWWPRGCANMTAYQHYPRLALPVTEKLCDEVIALPFSVDLNKEEIDFIATELGALIG